MSLRLHRQRRALFTPPPDTLPYVRQLAERGRTTRDPGVLQWALAVCQRHPDQALQRAAQSRRFGMQPSLGAAVDAATPADMLPYVAMHLLIEAIGVEAALVNRMGWSLLTEGCGPASPLRRDTCASLADTMVENGQDLQSLGLAVRIGERMGWPAERVAAGKAAGQRLTAALMPASFEPQEMYSCAAIDTTRRWIRDREQLGERVALEKRAAATAAVAGAPNAPATSATTRR